MEVGSIAISTCGSRVTLRPVPEGMEMPAESSAVESQIDTLNEMTWALTTLKGLIDLEVKVRAMLGRPDAPGELNLSDHTWEMWGAAVDNLVQNGIPREELSQQAVIREVVRLLTEENPVDNAGEIVKLNQLLSEIDRVYNPIRQACNSSECAYPQAAEIFRVIPDEYIAGRGYRPIFKGILEKLAGSLSALADQLNYTGLNWSLVEVNRDAESSQQFISQIEGLLGRANVLITGSCTEYANLVPQPPVIVPPPPPPPPPPPVTTPEEELKFNFALSLAPAYGLLVYGDQRHSSLEADFSLHGMAGARLDFNNELSLQIDYSGLHNVSQDFSYSRVIQDAAYVSVAYENYVPQLAFLTQYDNLNGERSFLGAAGFGINLYNGLLYPFAGGLAGTSFGGYAGVRSSYTWEELMKLNVSGQLFYSYLDGHEAGASISSSFSPASFLGNDFRIGVGASGAYADDSANFLAGLTISYGSLLAPQPVSVRQLIGGY